MEEDLILGDPSQDENEEEVLVEYEESSQIDYVTMGVGVFETLQSIDTMLMSKAAKKRIDQMKYWSMKIAWLNLKEIYDEQFFENETDE